MTLRPYDRQAAVAYAHRWAYLRNPAFYNFDKLGGDCTNFASQCLYAGAGVMDYTPTFGWYYNSQYSRAPAWTARRRIAGGELPHPGEGDPRPGGGGDRDGCPPARRLRPAALCAGALCPQPGGCGGGQSSHPGQRPGGRPQRGCRLPAPVYLPHSGGTVSPHTGGAPLT